jgi:DNA polymerase-3 subunit gamma/tau
MIGMLTRIATSEGAEIAQDALALITRAAEGSARDATSLLDQAISHGAGETTADQVRAMLGLADRGRVLDLFDMILRGDAGNALNELSAQYADGADPMAVLRDLAEITHWVSVVKITPDAAEDPTVSPDERARGLTMANELPMRVLTRMWQMLLKALEEVAAAPNAMMAAEMAIIRLTHVADLPSPEELVRKLQDTPPPPPAGPGGGNGMRHSAGGATHAQGAPMGHAPQGGGRGVTARAGGGGQVTALATQDVAALAKYPTFEHVIELIRQQRDVKLLVEVEGGVRLANYSPGRIEFEPAPKAPNDLAQRLGSRLQRWTGSRWAVTLVNTGGAPSVAEIRDAAKNQMRAEAEAHPLVMAVMDAFPKAKITDIKSRRDLANEALAEALPEVEDEWDPFEE